ncbi:hypothetical protein [Brevundimonas sp. SORGH_AS_0993]|uniref:hypothetical protein n=1 Tax=Brevundimonas sp. SORGH_AS_0993 TaxID=3041794 RepID=UPI0027D8EE92|nr:hypothetical protein [Brevundimonas sp. SORGH_AS_0993]
MAFDRRVLIMTNSKAAGMIRAAKIAPAAPPIIHIGTDRLPKNRAPKDTVARPSALRQRGRTCGSLIAAGRKTTCSSSWIAI